MTEVKDVAKAMGSMLRVFALMFFMFMFVTVMYVVMDTLRAMFTGRLKPEKTWEFNTEDELNDFANQTKQYASVVDGWLVFNPPSGENGIVSRYEEKVYKLVKMKFGITVSTIEYNSTVISVYTDDASVYKYVSLIAVGGDKTKLRLYGGTSESCEDFTNPNAPMVLEVDFSRNKAKVFSDDLLLAEVDIVEQTTGGSIESKITIVESNVSGVITDVSVDYVTIVYR